MNPLVVISAMAEMTKGDADLRLVIDTKMTTTTKINRPIATMSDRERTARSGDRRRGRQNTPEARERQKRRLTEWATALDGLNFESFSQADRVDYLMLKNHIQYRLKRLEIVSDSDDDERPAALDSSGIAGRPIGRDALLRRAAK